MATNVKILDLFSSLKKEEVIDFQRFIQSPFFNKGLQHAEMEALLLYLIDLKKGGDKPGELEFDREKAFAKVFPDQNFVEKKIEKVLSALHGALKNFVSYNAYCQPAYHIDRQIRQLEFLRERGLHNRYKNLSATLEEEILRVEVESLPFLKKTHEFKYEKYLYDFQYNIKNSSTPFFELIESLEVSYWANKLEILNQYLTISYFSSVELPDDVRSVIESSDFPIKLIEKHPLLHITYGIFMLLRNQDTSVSDVKHLQNLSREYENVVERDKLKQVLTYLRNVCVLGTLKRRNEFFPLLFQLSKEHYERGYLYHDGKITSSALISISQTALINREFEWCKHFIDEQKDKILNDTPEQDYYHLALANFYTHKGDFDQALSLVPATMPTPDIHLLAKRIELKCYYETKSPLLDAKIDAFRMFLSRISKNTISDQLHQSNSNFLNILNQIHMSIPGDKKRNQKILERIEEKSYLFEREWLIKKVNER